MAPETVQEQDVRPVAHGERRDARAVLEHDVVDAHERRAAAGEAEHALEADREVEVAAGIEEALRERLDTGQLAPAQPQPGVGVGADHDVGVAAGHPARTRAPWVVQRTSHVWPMSPSRMWYVASKSRSAPR